MKHLIIKLQVIVALIFSVTSCSKQEKKDDPAIADFQILADSMSSLERTDRVKAFVSFYEKTALSMSEFQLTLTGINDIEFFYKEIFHRQKIKTYRRKVDELITLGKTIVEIGTFNKEYAPSDKPDTTIIQSGQYWHVWHLQPDGRYKIAGEALGFFHAVAHPEQLTIPGGNEQPDESEVWKRKDVPFELKAYNALMEKGVRTRDGSFRSEFFMSNGSFKPYADSTVTGIEKIKPYLIAYSSGGMVTIDTVSCYTYEFEEFKDAVLEYDMFKVRWHVPDHAGRTEGKGIRIWKRQKDASLKLFREIGTHNLIQ